jgi:hypothetical protein
MSIERRTVAQWVHYLEAPEAQLTITEFMALSLVHIRENVKDARLGIEHLEGMLGTLDAFLAGTDPRYGVLANGRGKLTASPVARLEPETDARRD